MDEFRARIHDDLRGIIKGDLLFEPVERAPYALDASLYEIDPLGVVAPSTRDDLVALVRYVADQGIPLHARGAGTGLVGGCLGRGIVVDFSKHLRRIIEVRSDSVVVQPGVVLDVLNAQLAPLGRRIAPDPGRSEARTIGGMIAVDSAGARSLRDGSMVDYVERLAVVFANGEAAELALGPWPVADEEPADFQGAVARKVAMLLTWHADLIAHYRPRMPRRWPGYALTEVSRKGGLDLAKLIVGSEGTLALVTEATLRTVPIPPAQAVIVLSFARLNDAAEAAPQCLDDGPSACELHDWRSIRLVRDADPLFRDAIAEAAEAVLIVEFEGDDPDAVARQARALANRQARTGRLIADPFTTTRRSDCERLLGLRRAVVPLLMRSRDPARAVPLIEDVAVRPKDLAAFLNRLQELLRGQGVSWTLYAHAGAGQLHVRPFLDLSDARDIARLEPLATEVYDAVAEFGGTIADEHGCGLVRTQFLRKHYSELEVVFREVKNAFDPQNLLNPGKIVGDDPHLIVQDLRPLLVPGAAPGTPGALHVLSAPLIWPDGRRDEHVSACNACGACRSHEPTMRMCPTFRATGAEAASPRAKTHLLRQIASGVLDPKTWGSEELKSVADLCVHCNMCTIECPGGVDVSSLMLEAKAAFVEDHGLTTNDWLLSRVDLWSSLASRTPLMFNALMGHRGARWLLERMFGLSKHRQLPKAHRTTFLRRAERLGLTKARPRAPGPRVAFFVDIMANHFDQRLAEAVVAVLQHAGI
ncbi:MAG: FAD-linked oxidase C-terminal domain-containing protein, partial [Isosphaeraceae bacterium]